jgi:hypothetical protein
METPHTDNLQQALKQLPQYQAPPRQWDQIEAELAQQNATPPLQRALRQLPVYRPPQRLWHRIRHQLPAPAQNRGYWRAAAVILLLLLPLTGWLYLKNMDSPNITVQSEALLDDNLRLQDVHTVYRGVSPEERTYWAGFLDTLNDTHDPFLRELKTAWDSLTALPEPTPDAQPGERETRKEEILQELIRWHEAGKEGNE